MFGSTTPSQRSVRTDQIPEDSEQGSMSRRGGGDCGVGGMDTVSMVPARMGGQLRQACGLDWFRFDAASASSQDSAWEVETERGWEPFDRKLDELLKRTALEGAPTMRFSRGNWDYEIDFGNMCQVALLKLGMPCK